MAQATIYPLYVENYASPDSTTVKVFTFTVTVTDTDDDPLPNLENAFSIFTVKSNYSATEALVSVSTETNNIVINHTTGEITLTLLNGDLDSVPRNREEVEYVYDWDLVDTTGKFIRLLKGSITFAGDL